MKNQEVYIIAEAAQGYEGSVDIAKLLVKAAINAKADAIKFQVVYAQDLCEKDYEYYDLFKQLELTQTQWQEIRGFAKKEQIDFVVDVFGSKSFEMIQGINVDGIKLHSTNFFDNELTSNVLGLNKNLYLSVGGIKYDEIVEFITRHNITNTKASILFGFQAEPTPLESNNLLRIQTLKDKTGLDVGFMDHSEAGGEYDNGLSVLALGMGVRVFEKHITLDRELELEDYVSALTPLEFTHYVKLIKNLPIALGLPSLDLTENEIAYRERALKKVVAAKNIRSGDVITREDVRLSRPASPSKCYKLTDVLGKKAITDLPEGSPINSEDIV